MTLRLARSEPSAVAILLAAAGLAWWITVERMAGMDAGPGTDLGALGWFTGAWAVMMAAMMLPSFAPTAARYATLSGRREPSRWLLFTGGYLLAWSAAGLAAYGLFALGKSVLGSDLAWRRGGPGLACGVLVLAALYELTPLKGASLRMCRSPGWLVREARRDGRPAALATGARAGGWCLMTSWGLMAALFALGVMSLTWMALVAGVVALQKIGPWPRLARALTTAILIALAVAILAALHEIPGLVVPGSPGAMQAMGEMR